ncbi:MAG: hypothetical protein RLZZ347_683 [Candidatus Parcubacteria bacterium]|jgi:hypothetical protein
MAWSQPAIGVFPTGTSNTLYNYTLLCTAGRVNAILIENIPGIGQVVVSRNDYPLYIRGTPQETLDDIQVLGLYTATSATYDTNVVNRSNIFDIRITAFDTNDAPRLSTAVSFTMEYNPFLRAWRLPPSDTAASLPVDLVRAGPESYAPTALVFNDYPDMTNAVIILKDMNGVITNQLGMELNLPSIIPWYAGPSKYGSLEIKGQKYVFTEGIIPKTKLQIDSKFLTNGLLGEIVITRTNAFGPFLERYRLEDGQRIVAQTSLNLTITNSMPTLNIVSEPLSRVRVDYATNTVGAPIWNTATNIVISVNGLGFHPCTSTTLDSSRIYRLVHW